MHGMYAYGAKDPVGFYHFITSDMGGHGREKSGCR